MTLAGPEKTQFQMTYSYLFFHYPTKIPACGQGLATLFEHAVYVVRQGRDMG